MIHRSPYPDVDIPERPLTEYVFSNVNSEAVALVDGATGAITTYGDLRSQIERLAAELAARGVKKGDVCAIFSPNLPQYVTAFHGVASAGAIVTTANPLQTVDELAKQLDDARAVCVFTIAPLLDTVRKAASRCGIDAIYMLDDAEGGVALSELCASDAPAPDVAFDARADLICLPYSSGTTGLPKGVMLTHHNLVSNICQLRGSRGTRVIDRDDTLIAVLPFFHIYGLLVLMNYSLTQGAKLVTMARFDMEQFLQLLDTHKVTFAHLVPPIVLGLAKHPAVDSVNLDALGGIMCGAAPLGEDVAEAAAKRIGCVVNQGYGMTEASPVTHIAPNLPGFECNPGSIGPAIPNTEVRVVDTTSGADLGVGETGEVLIRGPQVMRGYLGKPDATAETVDADGWLHTGDVGYVDENGHFFIVDRVKELIKYKAYQVAPAELEAVLLTHPGIADAAVVGRPDDEAGEVPVAFVVPKGETLDADEVMAHVASRVSPYKKLRYVSFVDAVPKSASGKILRRVLSAQVREAAAAK